MTTEKKNVKSKEKATEKVERIVETAMEKSGEKQKQTAYFGEIPLDKKIVHALTDMGFEEPSPIQQQTIPLALMGDDIIGQAQTGTGKTAAFGIPIIQGLNDSSKHIQALIMTPTRELAIQVAEEISKIGKQRRVKALPVYGGQPIDRQIRSLRMGVQVVIGTPGRLLDHIERKTIKLDNVKFLVLDEADEMLDMGFVEDMEAIMREIPEERQTLLFSATMPRPILMLTQRYMKKPHIVTVSKEELTVPLIEQIYYETTDKVECLSRVLDVEETGKTIIFCRTKKGVDDLVVALATRGYTAEGLHGDLSQTQRDRVMKKFRDGSTDILIATDVAARGLDIDNITHVVNYDIPQDPESYVHRIGRTGRAGNKGVAMTFITPREFRQLKLIERVAKTRIVRKAIPSAANVLEKQKDSLIARMYAVLEQDRFADYKSIVEDLQDAFDLEDIAAAAIQYLHEGPKALEVPEAPAKRSFTNTGGKKGMVRLFINVGRAQKIQPPDIVRAIASEADIEGRVIGAISIYDKFTFVEVPEDVAERVVEAMHRNTIKGFKINVEPAKAR